MLRKEVLVGMDQVISDMADAVFIDEERRARIQHRCSACGSLIEVGTYYQYIKGVKGKNGFYLKYICKGCYGKSETRKDD